ncbi:hypothetical protein JMJ35_009196 [Cladonia borealis]|uniref:Rhodopsin domain-containing protein n=1 Tax=Cladonia borealis TaxID=184061 RepID=A0AA39QRZ2_9LECA|nr:hypothetical protein JMJ35_009196 [Cladonia borealis]
MSSEQAPGAPPEIGGLPPPSGVIPNFTDPDSITTIAIVVAIVFLSLTTVTTSIRCYTKLFLIRKHGWDDYTMFMAWAGNVAYSGLEFYECKYGAGVHQWDVLITEMGSFARVAYFVEVLYPPVIALVKLSICLQLIRIFVANHGKEFWCIQIFIWINMSYFLTLTFFSIFQCNPIAKFWDVELQGHCFDLSEYFIATGIFNFVSDIVMLLFPLYCTWKLQMSTKNKFGVSAIFFVGVLALVSDALRIYYSVIYATSQDQTFNLTRLGTSAAGETTAGILAGNLVVFPKFFGTYYPKITRFGSGAVVSWKSRLTKRHTESSTSSSNEHDTGNILQDYGKLNDNTLAPTTSPSIWEPWTSS